MSLAKTSNSSGSAVQSSSAVVRSSSAIAQSSSAIVQSSSATLQSSAAASAASATATVAFASTDPNGVLWNIDDPNADPSPQRGTLGAPILGPDNIQIDIQNPDLLAPPTTDQGSVSNAKWPFSLSHNRLQTGGWARQENIGVMPIATAMASVNMRLEAGAIRELHWHKTSEWAYVLKGTTQITAVDTQGRNYIATGPGDLWYFPPGIPHSLQATNDTAEGSEFILVFDDGAFSEDSTFLLTDWLAHVPAEVIQKNFQASSPAAFSHIPAKELYIFPSSPPPSDNSNGVTSPQGSVPDPFSFALSKVNATQLSGGTVKIVDSSTFTVSTTIAAAEVTVEPGAIRSWHPTMDEWSFFIEGQARVTIFASQGNARTFNYQQKIWNSRSTGYVPTAMGHYVENIGNTTLRFLEIFNTDRFEDISLNQWLALTPPDLVKAHLQLDDATIDLLSKTKPVVVG
ncbi:oxalate decarboxylase [Mycena floridula]|nr:oxalate decarboxylase [Mycena floridula]